MIGEREISNPTPKRSKKRKGRRARGTGTIFFDEKKQRWRGRKPIGTDASGRTRFVERWGTTQAAVVKALEKAGPPGESTTVAGWAARWLTTLSIRPATRANYTEDLDNHVLPALGHLRVAAVKPSHIESLASALTGKGLHVNTARKILDTARVMFAAAVREELIVRNPVAVARRPKSEKAEILPFSPAELHRIIESAPDLSSGPLLALLAGTGCRLGEASGLDIPDWNRAAGTISISKTYSRRFGEGPPKSKYSKRTITVPTIVRPHLEAAAGKRSKGPLFITGNGRRFAKSLVQKAFKRLLVRLELKPRAVHQLRHSVATALISSGTPIGDVAKYLGDSVATVVKTYLHPSGSDPAVDLDKLLKPRKS